MSETTFVVLAAVLGPLWLAIIVTRTVLAERAAEPGVPLARPRPCGCSTSPGWSWARCCSSR
ncbi:hypothetical protein [Kutzneria kofuensis]|uniref:hypothetical protein n=1 Tax=Kutzneria kofuensis TaxID=103725 RepID=UPI0031EA1993